MTENRREFFRVSFDKTVNGEIILSDGDSMFIYLDNLSVKGLGFKSSVELPLLTKVECRFEIVDIPFIIEGSIIRKSRKSYEIEYGVGFKTDKDTSSKLFKELNNYQIRQRKIKNTK